MKTLVTRHLSLVTALAALAASADPAAADGLLSADELVPMLSAGAPETAPADSRTLLEEIIALRKDGPARRDPDLRAARWLELAERAEEIGWADPILLEQPWRSHALPAAVRQLVAALPPPSRWPAMREALDARAAAADPTNQPPALSALRLSLACLSGDAAASSNALEALLLTPGRVRDAHRGDPAKRLRRAVLRLDLPDGPAEEPDAGQAASVDPSDDFLRRLASRNDGLEETIVEDDDLALPDKTLALIPASLTVHWVWGSDAVRARFRALVRDGGAATAAAPSAWAFADTTPDGLAYFAERAAARNAPNAWTNAFARFAEKGPDGLFSKEWVPFDGPRPPTSSRTRNKPPLPPEAESYLRAVTTLCGRDLAAGRVEAADARLDAALPESVRSAAALAAAALSTCDFDEEHGWSSRPLADAPAVADFVARRALPPASPATATAVALFVLLDPPLDDAAAARLDALASRLEGDPDIDGTVLFTLASGRLKAALASGRFDDASDAARRAAKFLPSAKILVSTRTGAGLHDFARAMLAVGETNRFDEALALARAMPNGARKSEFRRWEAEMLARAGRADEAQALYAEDVAKRLRELEREDPGQPFGTYSYGHWEIVSDLHALVELYLDAGRPADALALFERVPLWEAADAKDFNAYSPRLRLLARALAGVGRTDDAVRVARHAVECTELYGSDWPWEILIERLPADEFLALAERVHGIDPWEERPVQWKAEALRRAGRLDEAEAAARLALKIDPTDGESPAGERIRSYAILASILEEKGGADAAKEAATLRSVVAAVRLAEKGDELAEAGLVSLALEAYDGAAALFSDAYCVQWRLAERLRERGFPDLAAAHYEETFRRMPEQFGRVASLCFGCAGVFDSGESVSAAERILPELAARPGALPATHRLLGMLRREQKRFDEAWDAFRAALDADPDYLDAVNDLLALRGKVDRPRADWEFVQRRAIELDPLGLHVRIDPDDVIDWTTVREVNAAARARLPDVPDSVFPLPASASALAAIPKPDVDWSRYGLYWSYALEGDKITSRAFDAASAFAEPSNRQTWLAALCEWLDAAAGGR